MSETPDIGALAAAIADEMERRVKAKKEQRRVRPRSFMGEWLAHKAQRAGITITEVARRMGADHATLHAHFYAGSMKLDTLMRWADALGIDPREATDVWRQNEIARLDDAIASVIAARAPNA